MGMGYAGCRAYVVSDEDLRKLVPAEYDAFIQTVEASEEIDETMGDTKLNALAEMENNGQNAPDDVAKAYSELCSAFAEITKVNGKGLSLNLFNKTADSGDDCYDDIEDGHYWEVSGMDMLTPAGEKFKEIITEQSWVHFG